MPTTKEEKEKIISRLQKFGIIDSKPMMGEYLIYLNGKYVG